MYHGSLARVPAGETAVFKGFWYGPPLGRLRTACIRSFLDFGYDFEIYTYGPVTVPSGVTLRKADEIIPFAEMFFYDNPETGSKDVGPFSDLFRFKLLMERGGWWMDVDTICLLAGIPRVDRAWAQQVPEYAATAIGTGQIAFGKDDPVVTTLYQRCLELSRTRFSPREALGPHLLSRVIKELGLPPNMYGSPDTFYPLRFIEMFKLWLPEFADEVRGKCEKALFCPIFQSFPQYIGLEFNKLPPRDSFLGAICERYGGSDDDAPRYESDEILAGTRNYFRRHSDWAPAELTAVSGPGALERLGV